jgi:MFS family permease
MRVRSIAPLFIGTFLQRANSGAGTVVYGLLLAHLAGHNRHTVTSLQVGLLPVAFYITELTFAPLMGSLSDRWGRHPFLIFGPLLGLVQVGLLIFTPDTNPLPYMLCLQVVSGISGAMTTPAALGYLADYTAQAHGHRMRVMSFYELVTSGGIAVGTVLGGFAWFHLERLAFALFAFIYLVVALCMALLPTVRQVIERARLRVMVARYGRVLRTPRLFFFIPAWICINALVGVWLSSQITFILSAHVHNPNQLLMGSLSGPGGERLLSFILGGFVLFFSLSLLFWAFFLHHISRLHLMLTSVLGIYLACIALAGINHRGVGNDWLLYIWVPLLLIGVFAETSFAPSALAYLADISEDVARDRGLLMGLYSIFLGVGQILGNGLGGIFAQSFGFDGLIYLTVLLACIALASLLWLFHHEKRLFTRSRRQGTHVSRNDIVVAGRSSQDHKDHG